MINDALTLLKATAVAAIKPEPEIVIVAPVAPEEGLNEMIDGSALTTIVIPLLVTGLPFTQVALLVITQVIASLLFNVAFV